MSDEKDMVKSNAAEAQNLSRDAVGRLRQARDQVMTRVERSFLPSVCVMEGRRGIDPDSETATNIREHRPAIARAIRVEVGRALKGLPQTRSAWNISRDTLIQRMGNTKSLEKALEAVDELRPQSRSVLLDYYQAFVVGYLRDRMDGKPDLGMIFDSPRGKKSRE